MSENKLKKKIFWFFFFAKLFTVLFIIDGWQLGAFEKEEMFSLLTIVLPLFTVYTSVMFDEIVKKRYVDAEKTADRKLQSTFKNLVYVALPIYVLAILGIILLGAKIEFLFKEIQTALVILESGLGIYIGRIIFALFKKEEKSEKE